MEIINLDVITFGDTTPPDPDGGGGGWGFPSHGGGCSEVFSPPNNSGGGCSGGINVGPCWPVNFSICGCFIAVNFG